MVTLKEEERQAFAGSWRKLQEFHFINAGESSLQNIPHSVTEKTK